MITSGTGDGVSVSPDGKTVYSEQGSINGYTIAPNGAQVFNSGAQFPSPDGTGVISGGTFNGDIIVNDNSGGIYLLGLFDRLGIAQPMQQKTVVFKRRSDRFEPVARGDVELGFNQMSEILAVQFTDTPKVGLKRALQPRR